MSTHASTTERSPELQAYDLQELSDPEFFAHWAAVRNRLFRTPKSEPGHCEVKRRYDAANAEYRRRIDGKDHL